MANSDDLSAETTPAAPPRKRFHLGGPSVPLEPGRHAVRRDLAEMAVADRVFSQHYAEPWVLTLTGDTPVHMRPSAESDIVTTLATGSSFHLLDLGQSWAWGRGDASETVGYVAAAALNLP